MKSTPGGDRVNLFYTGSSYLAKIKKVYYNVSQPYKFCVVSNNKMVGKPSKLKANFVFKHNMLVIINHMWSTFCGPRHGVVVGNH